MLERLIVRNFKLFEEIEVELGQTVIFIGPNNSGKTSALQALALWELGVRTWAEKRGDAPPPKRRSGVTINRRDLVSLPVPETNLLWRRRHVREGTREGGKTRTTNVRIEIEVRGITSGKKWSCGMEFDYANPESIYCRPLGLSEDSNPDLSPIPPEARQVRVAYLPPMSGIASNETRLDTGAIHVRLGEGRTAEVLRNICYQLLDISEAWDQLVQHVRSLFGINLHPPEYVPTRGELSMEYEDQERTALDISCTGRGVQQSILLLGFLLANPDSVLLLDEPDAHLEILRQRQLYDVLTDVASAHGCQVIAASHSEVLLGEAADRDVVIAFVGKPHRIDDRGSQVLKSLSSIGFDDYYKAEVTGWVLYLEGSTDLAILGAFARLLGHEVAPFLDRPFVHYIGNQPNRAREHFHGLREAKQDLVGIAITDHLGRPEEGDLSLRILQWQWNEIENYLCMPDVLEAYAADLARTSAPGELFADSEADRYRQVMRECIRRRVPPAALEDPADRWWRNVKATDEFLDPVFAEFFERLSLPNLMRKSDYHQLARFVRREQIVPEIEEKLAAILEVARKARPRQA